MNERLKKKLSAKRAYHNLMYDHNHRLYIAYLEDCINPLEVRKNKIRIHTLSKLDTRRLW